MATNDRKPSEGSGRGTRGKTARDLDRIIDAALDLASERAWRDITLRDIAEAADQPLSAVYRQTPSKGQILAAYTRRIDAAVLEGDEGIDPEDSPHDRLFDVLMRRFEAMEPRRSAIANILQGSSRDPCALLGGAMQLGRSMDWSLEAAGLSAPGLSGILRRKALAAAYLATLRVWLRDESEDMAQTMSALDRNLRRLEQAACMLRRRRRRSDARADQEAASEGGAAGQTA